MRPIRTVVAEPYCCVLLRASIEAPCQYEWRLGAVFWLPRFLKSLECGFRILVPVQIVN